MKRRNRAEDAVSPTLEAVLAQLIDRDFARRLRTVYMAAAVAIDQLSALNLVRYEVRTSHEDGPADLSLWEEMAPAVRDTVIAVNGLLTVIREQFPQDGSAPAADPDREDPASLDRRLAQEVESVLQRTAERLGREIASVREKVLRPEVVSDRWALITELQSVRRDLRRQVGDLVYLTAAAYGDVDRSEVVPGHQAEVDSAAKLRSTAAELRRSLQGKLQRLTDDAGAPAIAKQIDGDLEMFTRMPAFLALRTSEKREVAQFRVRLSRDAEAPDLTARTLRERLTPLLDLLRRFGEETTRELLTAHDREVWVSCGLSLEQAQLHLTLGSAGARRAFGQAVKSAAALHGLDPDFDGYLRRLRNARLNALSQAELEKELATFREHLGRLPFH